MQYRLGVCSAIALAVIFAFAPSAGAQIVVTGSDDANIGCRGFSFSFSGGSMIDDFPAVLEVPAGSPGEQAGLLPGDKLIEVNGHNLIAVFSMVASGNQAPPLWRHAPGTAIPLRIGRGAVEHNLTLVIGRREDGPPQKDQPRRCVPVAQAG